MSRPGVAASAFSIHPHVAHAAGECAGTLLESGLGSPSLLMIAVGPAFAERLRDIAALARSVLKPYTVVGVAAETVTDGLVLSSSGGIAMLAWSPPGRDGDDIVPIRIGADRLDQLGSLACSTAVIFADPFSVESQSLHDAATPGPVQRFNGGFLSTARRRGATGMLLDDQVFQDGIVGFGTSHAVTVASSGGVLLGQPLRVDSAEGDVVYEIDGRPAVEVVVSLLNDLGSEMDAFDALDHGLIRLGLPLDSGIGSADRTMTEHEVVDTIPMLGIEPLHGEPLGLRVGASIQPGSHVYFESFEQWAQEADLERQWQDLDTEVGAAVIVQDPLRLARSPAYRTGEHTTLEWLPSLGIACSEVFERHRGSVRSATDRLVATGLTLG